MKLQYMLGHYPAFFHPNPKSVLIVGCGAGVTAGSFILHPEIKRIVICEIEPLVPEVVAQYFAQENNGVVTRGPDGKLSDPRVEIVYDDARHFILTTKEKFDIITSDPIHPWVKGAATLYTKEYFELVKAHLNPGGLVTQWVPLYQSSEPTVKSEVCTFFNVFPEGVLWSNPDYNTGYDTITMGGDAALKIDMKELQRRIDALPVAAEKLGAAFVNPGEPFRAVDILKTYAGAARDMKGWTEAADAQINYDRNLRLQYLAGASLNGDYTESTATLNSILRYRKFPGDMVTATESEVAELLDFWSTQGR
jgi:spermidine synthase